MKSGGSTKLKVRLFQQSTSSWKVTFKSPNSRLKNKSFDFAKQRHVAEFVMNLEDIYNFIKLNYKHRGPKMATAINNTENSFINTPKDPE